MTVFVRFAPSPTGLLHIGNIRSALFNYLFAKRHRGRLMLRLDDTDRERSTSAFADMIERDLKWLGLEWDVFVRQSDRTDRYTAALQELIASDMAYPCFETQAELALKRKTQLGRGLPPIYDRAALRLSIAERERLIAEGHKPHWRFKLDTAQVVEWQDGIQGHKSLPASSLSDPVIVREDGVPLYTFCSVVDDAELGITHVIRGEDHVTNTAVQLYLWKAISDSPLPQVAHFPLIVNATGEEMSKRLGTLSIASIRDDMGIAAMAINSLLARLGTADSPTPCLSLPDLAATFDLERISRATPKFDMADLRRMNAGILHITPFSAVAERLAAQGITGDKAVAFWEAVRTNLSTIADAAHWWDVVQGKITTPAIATEDADFIHTAVSLLPPEPWAASVWSDWTCAITAATGRKGRALFHPLRLALTGCEHGPEMKSLLPLIGRDVAVLRLESCGTSTQS